MSELPQCLWCGDYYTEGMEGCCRKCWENSELISDDLYSGDPNPYDI